MMCKLNHQASETTLSSYENWTKYQQLAIKLSQIVVLVGLLGIGKDLVMQKAIAQEATTTTRGNVARVNLAVNRQAEETYESLVSRAETVAMSALKQRFHQDKHIPAVSVVIVGHNQGAIAPVLAVEVDRKQWQKAQTKEQIKFFTTARQLLGFDGSGNNNSSAASAEMQAPEDPEIMQDRRDIENYNRRLDAQTSEANSSDIIPELDNVQAPAIVPVDTPTPEVPGILPIDAPVPADTNPDTPMMPASDASNLDATQPSNPANPTPSNLTPEAIPDSNGMLNNLTAPMIP